MNDRLNEAVGDLAIGLGFLIAGGFHGEGVLCYIESVVALAKSAGVSEHETLQPFDMHRREAKEAWDRV